MTFPASTPNWFDWTEAGAPTLNNAAGSMLEVLRACLVNGFGAVSVTSIVVASGVATATAATHGLSAVSGKLVLIEGAPEAALNGRKRIGNVLTNTFTFPAPGVADGTYTSTISARRAPLGWTEAHTGTNKAIFARTAPEATAMLLRIDDTHVSPSTATDARVLMVESATDVDTYVNPSPTPAQVSGGSYWFKGANTAAAKPWAIFGDDRFFYIVMPGNNGTIGTFSYVLGAFGDPVPTKTPDPYACMLAGAQSSVTSGVTAYRLPITNAAGAGVSSTHTLLARAADQVTMSRRCETVGIGGSGVPMGVATAGQSDVQDFQVATGALLGEESTSFLRARLPGLYWPLARAPFQGQAQFSPVNSVQGLSRTLISVLFVAQSTNGNLMVDVEGPWR